MQVKNTYAKCRLCLTCKGSLVRVQYRPLDKQGISFKEMPCFFMRFISFETNSKHFFKALETSALILAKMFRKSKNRVSCKFSLTRDTPANAGKILAGQAVFVYLQYHVFTSLSIFFLKNFTSHCIFLSANHAFLNAS